MEDNDLKGGMELLLGLAGHDARFDADLLRLLVDASVSPTEVLSRLVTDADSS